MDLQQKNYLNKINGIWENTSSTSERVEITSFLNRSTFASFLLKNSIFVYGGSPNPLPSLEIPNTQIYSSHLFRFALNSRQWNKYALNFPVNHNLSCIAQFGFVNQGNILYLFGGRNWKNRQIRNSDIYTINVDTYVVKKIETKGVPPNPCLSPKMVFLNKGSILVFGGSTFNKHSGKFSYENTMHVYKVDLRNWVQMQNDCRFAFPTFINPNFLVLSENQIYLFGGHRETVGNNGDPSIHKLYNKQLFRLKPVPRTTSPRADVFVRKIFSTNEPPFGQNFQKAVGFTEKYIIGFEQKNDNSKQYKSLWILDTNLMIWIEVNQKNTSTLGFPIICDESTSFFVSNEKIYTLQKNGKIANLLINQGVLDKDLRTASENCQIRLCSVCASEQLNLQFLPSENKDEVIPAHQLRGQFESLTFPFAAIGLLIDNARIIEAKSCHINFNHRDGDYNKYIIIEDDGQTNLLWGKDTTAQQFLEISRSIYITGLSDDNLAFENIDQQIEKSIAQVKKKQKSREKELSIFMKQQAKGSQNLPLNALVHVKTQKDFEKEKVQNLEKHFRLEYKRKLVHMNRNRKIYMTNIKAAGIRLGDIVISVSKQKTPTNLATDPNATKEVKQIRRAIFVILQTNQKTNEEQYLFESYYTVNGVCGDPRMQSSFKTLSKQYKRELKLINERLKSMSHAIYIGNLKKKKYEEDPQKMNEEDGKEKQVFELNFRKKFNDVFYGDPQKYNKYEESNQYSIQECLDFSLKTYLSLLYLNQEQFNITLSVRENNYEIINSQPFLPQIDKNAKAKKFIELDHCFDFGDVCNIIETYWNPEGWKHGFAKTNMNFTLNGVLIYHQDRLISRFKTELGTLLDSLDTDTQIGHMFGYVELKDFFPVNITRTGFTYPMIMEKYYSRLRFVMQYFREYQKNKGKDKSVRKRPETVHQKPSKKIKNQ